jgi:hypothetical protein
MIIYWIEIEGIQSSIVNKSSNFDIFRINKTFFQVEIEDVPSVPYHPLQYPCLHIWVEILFLIYKLMTFPILESHIHIAYVVAYVDLGYKLAHVELVAPKIMTQTIVIYTIS